MNERDAMARAIALAWTGWGRVHPNPLVGAVLIREGRVIGEGWHAEFGGPHAEVAALMAAGDARGATCVVTLEPCAHHGKTPPCTEALTAAGVRRVVYAVPEPTPEARGGAERLRHAGLEVVAGVMRDESAAMNAPFLCAARRPERPYVALKLAASLDGFIADQDGRSRWISGPEARAWAHWLRAGFDGIAVGRKTVMADDPSLTVRGPVTPRVPPARIVFAPTGSVPRDRQVIRTAGEVPTMVCTTPERLGAVERELTGTGARVVAAPDLSGVLAALRSKGVRSLLVEGGGTVGGALLECGAVDRLYWLQAPILLGGGIAAFGARRTVPLADAKRWTVVERRALGADTLLVADREPCSRES
jgi:diaminohydroxyphosphoribosylaminopyrimidine deaminase/5-amino-6-(5-phosphoribosylamino)uracil reductase